MGLDPVILDDLTWKGMVDAIRRRIPAASDGEWTLHAAVDPGVTLLELFAWQLEQRLYRMDQVPAPLTLGLLALLGTRPRRTRCASTVLELCPPHAMTLARGAEFMLDGAAAPLVFSTRAPLALLKLRPDGLRLWAGGRERSVDLAQGRAFALFGADGAPGALRVELALEQAPPAPGGWFGLWLRLRTAAPIAPQWSPEAAAAVPPPATLDWLYRATDGSLRPFAVDDGTGGLRRSGVVRLRIPADWQPESGLTYAIHARTARATFAAPPRLAALAPNAVIARHARATQLRALARAPAEWLAVPGNVIRLDQFASAPGQPDLPVVEGACVLCLKERDGRWHQWWPRASLHAAGPSDRVFSVDREHALLRFGDGINGRLPVLAAPGPGEHNIRLRYLVGGGSAGAAGPSAHLDFNWRGPHGIDARNLTETSGGAEAETLEQARQRSAAQLRVATRAVTRRDFEALARATPGVAVARAHAAIGHHPGHPCGAVAGAVTVFVVPDVPRDEADSDQAEDAFVAAPVPDPGMLAAVRARLERARLVATELFVSAPRYRALRLRALVRGEVDDPAALRARMAARLRRFLDPLRGGDEGGGWPFGEPVRVSVMLRELQAAAGKQVDVALVAIGLDGDEPGETCRALPIGAHELVWLEELALQVERGAAAAGGLR